MNHELKEKRVSIASSYKFSSTFRVVLFPGQYKVDCRKIVCEVSSLSIIVLLVLCKLIQNL